jgi:predicted enzyme related to lactoylglutathione lyase
VAKLFRVILPVNDIERAAAFYGLLFDQTGQRVSAGRHYFDCEGAILACYDPVADGDGYDATPNPEPLYFATDDLEAIFHRAKDAGAHFSNDEIPDVGRIGSIERRPWGEISFYAVDPFGNPLCFVSSESVFTGTVDTA